jgi:hypothetical protein
MTEVTKPFGLREVVFMSLDSLVAESLPASRTLSFMERVMSAEFTGDDELQGVVTIPIGCEGELEAGGISLEAYSLITGHTLTPGVGLDTLEGDASSFPYFQIFGKSVDDEGGDIHCKILKAKLTEALQGEFKYGEFFVNKMKFVGVKLSGKAFEFVANEVEDDLPVAGSPPAFTLSSSPADAATGVAIGVNVVLTFSNKLAPNAENGIILTTAAGVPVACARTIDSARKVVTLNPSANLGAATDHLVIVPGVTDIYGQALADAVIDFETA